MSEGAPDDGWGGLPDLRPKLVAIVSIRVDEVLAVEDLTEDNPKYALANNEPRKRVNGCMAALRGAPRPVRMNETREEVLKVVDPDGTKFADFKWMDLDNRKSA